MAEGADTKENLVILRDEPYTITFLHPRSIALEHLCWATGIFGKLGKKQMREKGERRIGIEGVERRWLII